MKAFNNFYIVLLTAFSTLLASSQLSAQGDTIRQYQFEQSGDGYDLVIKAIPRPIAGPNEVLVEVKAVSLNRRDIYMVGETGNNLNGTIPISDGAGEVIAVGANVTEYAVGDRVVGTFFTDWIDGRLTQQAAMSFRGGSSTGMLSEVIVTEPKSILPIPDYMTFAEAASLPCAAVTAWTGLFKLGGLQNGETVLLEGTGGVSTFGLQFAAAAGAIPFITSSSEDKLAVAREMGAQGNANYRQNADWQLEVLDFTDGVGIDHVLDIGGRDTLLKALEALNFGGHIAMIGGITGQAPALEIRTLLPREAAISAVSVGSRQDFQNMLDFMAEHEIHPLIDREFEFEQAQEAFDFMNYGSFMGKIVISM